MTKVRDEMVLQDRRMKGVVMESKDLDVENIIARIKKAEGFERVKFIILYGSAVRGEMRETSDIDLCIYYDGNMEEASEFRFMVLSELFEDAYDVHIFQQLPLYIRMGVLKGRILYCRDKRSIYDVAFETIKEFENFKHRFYDYIGKEAMA